MNLEEVIRILNNRLIFLDQQKTAAISMGDLDAVVRIDQEIYNTQQIIDKLQS